MLNVLIAWLKRWRERRDGGVAATSVVGVSL
jgi:hypothetical protein